MTIIGIFLDFWYKIMNFTILYLTLYDWLIVFTIIICIFKIIAILGNSKIVNEAKDKKKEGK